MSAADAAAAVGFAVANAATVAAGGEFAALDVEAELVGTMSPALAAAVVLAEQHGRLVATERAALLVVGLVVGLVGTERVIVVVEVCELVVFAGNRQRASAKVTAAES